MRKRMVKILKVSNEKEQQIISLYIVIKVGNNSLLV